MSTKSDLETTIGKLTTTLARVDLMLTKIPQDQSWSSQYVAQLSTLRSTVSQELTYARVVVLPQAPDIPNPLNPSAWALALDAIVRGATTVAEAEGQLQTIDGLVKAQTGQGLLPAPPAVAEVCSITNPSACIKTAVVWGVVLVGGYYGLKFLFNELSKPVAAYVRSRRTI